MSLRGKFNSFLKGRKSEFFSLGNQEHRNHAANALGHSVLQGPNCSSLKNMECGGTSAKMVEEHGVWWIVCKDGAKSPSQSWELTSSLYFLSSKCRAALWLTLTSGMWWKPVLGQALGGQVASAIYLSEANFRVKTLRLTTEWWAAAWRENGHTEENQKEMTLPAPASWHHRRVRSKEMVVAV